MRRYLAELSRKPDAHKKRFALLASGVITLFIFGIWSLAVFGTDNPKISDSNTSDKVANEVSPFESLRMNLGSSFEALKASFSGIKKGLEDVNLESEYQDMRNNTLNNYGE